MSQAIEIFISGITGVFFGMAFLYIAIRLMGVVADKVGPGAKEEKNA